MLDVERTWYEQLKDTEPHVANLEPELAHRLALLFKDYPSVYVFSGWRSSESQAYLFDGWQRRLPGFNPANPPGTSNHEAIPYSTPRAVAADLGGPVEQVHGVAHLYGIHFPIVGEPWHAQLIEVTTGYWPGQMPELVHWAM